MKIKIAEIIFRAIDAENLMLATKVDCSLEMQTALFGEGGQLDSMSLVSLIVGIEEQLEEQLGVSLILASDKAMSARRSPFATVATLTEYIDALMQEAAHV